MNHNMNQKKLGFCLENVSKIFDGKKYQFIGVYPQNEDLVMDLRRIHKKHGFTLKIENYGNEIKLWKRKSK